MQELLPHSAKLVLSRLQLELGRLLLHRLPAGKGEPGCRRSLCRALLEEKPDLARLPRHIGLSERRQDQLLVREELRGVGGGGTWAGHGLWGWRHGRVGMACRGEEGVIAHISLLG